MKRLLGFVLAAFLFGAQAPLAEAALKDQKIRKIKNRRPPGEPKGKKPQKAKWGTPRGR